MKEISEQEIKTLKVLINNKDVFYYEDDFNNRIRPLVGKLLDLYMKHKERTKETIYEVMEEVNQELNENLISGTTNRTPLRDKIILLKKENKKLKAKIEEYNKKGQTLHNLANVEGSLMYKKICKDFIPKERARELIKKHEDLQKIAINQIENRIIIADGDSLQYGRAQAHQCVINDLKKLLEEE